MIGCIAALLGIDRWEYRVYGEQTPTRVALWLLGVRIVLIEIICWLDQFKYSPFLYLVVLFLGCIYFGDLVGYGLGLLAWIVYVVKHLLASPDWFNDGAERHFLVLFTVGCIFAITIARVVLREKASRARTEELLAELERSHEQLKDYAGQIGELATTRERNRLAREIHDSLGHYLTVINVQLEKARMFREKKPAEADQAVNDAKRLASEALQDVRRSVSALRANQELPAFLPSATSLVAHTESAQLPIALHIEGDETLCSPSALLTLYRAVQEGLTNVQKHARAGQLWIDVRLEKQASRLALRDNGSGFDPAGLQKDGREHGYGLLGVQERLELLGGNLTITSAPGEGTTLSAWIPAPGREQEVAL